MKVVALDIGRVRTGVAVGDSALGVALARGTHGKGEQDALVAWLRAEKPAVLVVGLPKLLSGSEGEEARRVRSRAEYLARVTGIGRVEFFDERMTTRAAERSGAKDSDAEAARLILAGWMEKEGYG